MDMWKPFNYEYIVFYRPEQKETVDSILDEETNETTAWKNAKIHAQKNLTENPDDVLALFNLSIAEFHLGDPRKSIASFEKAESKISGRTLWYQIEPIQAYLQIKNFDKVLTMTEKILETNNLAFSELYLIRAESYRQIGNKQLAEAELGKAKLYNTNLQAVKTAEANLIANQPLFTSL